MKVLKSPFIVGLALSINFSSFSQAYMRTSKNVGVSFGISKDFKLDQTNLNVGIHTQINKYLIPELAYRNSTQYNLNRIQIYGENQQYITPALQFRTRFLKTPGRKVRGICTQEFADLAITPEYHFNLNSGLQNVFSVRTGLALYQFKSGMSKFRRAWSFKLETYYRRGFGKQELIKNEFGIQFKISRFQVYNFLN